MNNVSNENNGSFAGETWQAEVLGQIYETNLEELTQWITEGAILPEDKVRRGNLRWLQAGKVPPLIPFFNAKANGQEAPPQIKTSSVQANDFAETEANSQPVEKFSRSVAFENKSESGDSSFHASETVQNRQENIKAPLQKFCAMHAEEEAKYFCETCGNSFCKTCPNSYGGNVKICPMCGAMCRSVAETKASREKELQLKYAMRAGFGFSDFGKAVVFPFKHKTSLFLGAVMFMFFTLGQSAAAVGGMFMLAASIFCFMLANMLTFGVLANTIDNFSQGRLDGNFMPNFDDFSLWDDVVHPFFLSIGAYISSFGPLILIIAVWIYLMFSSLTAQMNTPPEEISRTVYPQQSDEQKVVDQSEQVKKLLENVKKNNPNGLTGDNINDSNPPIADQTEEQVRQTEEMIQKMRKDQLESAIGKSPETVQQQQQQMMKSLFAMGVPFFFLILLAFLWGMFYFPAACAVAGYTRSFLAAINPSVGLDTIKRLGLDYAKILLMSLIIVICSGTISIFLGIILSPFDLPQMGNIPAKAVGSLFTFYFSVVFSCILGFALYKASDRLKLYKG